MRSQCAFAANWRLAPSTLQAMVSADTLARGRPLAAAVYSATMSVRSLGEARAVQSPGPDPSPAQAKGDSGDEESHRSTLGFMLAVAIPSVAMDLALPTAKVRRRP